VSKIKLTTVEENALRRLERRFFVALKVRPRWGRWRGWKMTPDLTVHFVAQVEYQMWARGGLSAPKAIKAAMSKEKKGGWVIDIGGGEEAIEYMIPQHPRAKSTRANMAKTVERVYNDAKRVVDADPQLRQRCDQEREEAKRWHGVKVRLVKRSGMKKPSLRTKQN
jgi:hypothetical protein